MIAPAGAGGDPSAPEAPEAPEDEQAGRRLGWVGLGVALVSFLAGLMAASLFGGIYALARGLDQAGIEGDLGFALASSAGLWVGFLVMPLLWARRQGGPRRQLGLSIRWVDVAIGLGVGLLSTIVTGLVSAALLSRGEQDQLEQKAREVIDPAQGPLAVALLVAALCLVTPLAEEVFFRGVLFGSLQRVLRPWFAIPIAGMAFGLVHFDFEPAPAIVVIVQLGLLGLFGMALCGLVRGTGRLGASIVAHAAFNTVTVVTLLAER